MKTFLLTSGALPFSTRTLAAVLVSALATATLTTSAAPAGTGEGKKRQRPAAAAQRTGAEPGTAAVEALRPFDKNENRKIDADELTALQHSYGALKKLDANGNGEIEPAELERLHTAMASESSAPSGSGPGADDRKGRALTGLREVDKNANRKVDADEVPALEKMLGGGRVMERLDQNGNGKLEPDEVDRLNERLSGQGAGGLLGAFRSRFGGSSSSARKAPEARPASPLNVPPPIIPPRPEDEKPTPPPTPEPKPGATPTPTPMPFPSSGAGPKPPGGFGT